MATTIKSYTDIEQSKKLAEILPIESADGFWEYHDKWCSEGDEWEGYEDYPRAEPYLKYTRKENEWKEDKSDIPCWSLASLFEILREKDRFPEIDEKGEDGFIIKTYIWDGKKSIQLAEGNTLVDACYQMIIYLNELNLL